MIHLISIEKDMNQLVIEHGLSYVF